MSRVLDTPRWSTADRLDQKRVDRGTHRCRTIEETVVLAEAAARIIGVTRIANLTGLDRLGIPVYCAIAPNLNPGRRVGMLTVASGKGITAAHARASALMELVERWSALIRGDDPVIHGSYETVRRSHDVIDMVSAGWQRAMAQQPCDWATVTHLRTGRTVLAPSCRVYGSSSSLDGTRMDFAATSNGLAAGNTLAEATLHALYELIERDAERRMIEPGRRIDLEQLSGAPDVSDMMRRMVREDLELVVRELPTPTSVPTMAATCVDRRHVGCRALADGLGTHLDPRVALARAVSETVQSRAETFAASRDDLARRESGDADPHLGFESEARKTWLSTLDPAVPIASYENGSTETISGDVTVVLDRLATAGFTDVYVKDLTRTEVGIPVVRAIVPGLRARGRA